MPVGVDQVGDHLLGLGIYLFHLAFVDECGAIGLFGTYVHNHLVGIARWECMAIDAVEVGEVILVYGALFERCQVALIYAHMMPLLARDYQSISKV